MLLKILQHLSEVAFQVVEGNTGSQVGELGDSDSIGDDGSQDFECRLRQLALCILGKTALITKDIKVENWFGSIF